MPPNRRAGNSAYVQKFTKKNGENGYVLYCRYCRPDDDNQRQWSSRAAARKATGSHRRGREFDSFDDVMDLYVIHMSVHHKDHPQPDWQLSDDLDIPYFTACETKFFQQSKEEVLLRNILGMPTIEEDRQKERDIFELTRVAAKLGHRVELPGEKIPGVSGASLGWSCICGAGGHPEPKTRKDVQRKASRQHLRDVVDQQQLEQ